MEAIIVREARLADAPIIAELSHQLGYRTTVKQTETRLQGLLDSKDHAVLLACLPDHEVVGWLHVFLAFRVESDCFAEIGGLVVSDRFRSRGIGKSLIAAAEAWTAQKGIQKLRVRSRSERADALAFYEHLGFSTTKSQQVFDKLLR